MLAVALVLASATAHSAGIPRAAEAHRRDLVRTSRVVWGLGAPVAVLAGQVHQESAWNPQARSAHAAGLAQFTPATAEWIGGLFPAELGDKAPLDPRWAMRALCRYDKRLWDAYAWAATACDRWAFVLSAYNGGPGWVPRDRRMAAAAGADDTRWFGVVENYTSRSAAATRENRAYPRRILLKHQVLYRVWGPGVECEVRP